MDEVSTVDCMVAVKGETVQGHIDQYAQPDLVRTADHFECDWYVEGISRMLTALLECG
jgi:hypothetical protein